jgi:hypothetical protein
MASLPLHLEKNHRYINKCRLSQIAPFVKGFCPACPARPLAGPAPAGAVRRRVPPGTRCDLRSRGSVRGEAISGRQRRPAARRAVPTRAQRPGVKRFQGEHPSRNHQATAGDEGSRADAEAGDSLSRTSARASGGAGAPAGTERAPHAGSLTAGALGRWRVSPDRGSRWLPGGSRGGAPAGPFTDLFGSHGGQRNRDSGERSLPAVSRVINRRLVPCGGVFPEQ